jgi:hypothetical protein
MNIEEEERHILDKRSIAKSLFDEFMEQCSMIDLIIDNPDKKLKLEVILDYSNSGVLNIYKTGLTAIGDKHE